jgi:integrase
VALTDTRVRNLKPKYNPYKISDSGGLFLLVTSEGSRLWRLAYRYAGKQKTISFGSYPGVKLADAREQRDAARVLLRQGIDPSQARKDEERKRQSARSFREVAEEWWDAKGKFGKNGAVKGARTQKRDQKLLTNLYSIVGERPISTIDAAELHHGLAKLAKRGLGDTVARCRAVASRIFRYGMATGKCTTDPAHALTAVFTLPEVKHHPGLTDQTAVGDLMRKVSAYSQNFDGRLLTQLALQFLAQTLVRPGEVRHAEWTEFDLEERKWSISAEKMKMRKGHEVPLSGQAIAILNQAHEITGSCRYAFSLGKPMSDNTFNKALRNMGYDTRNEHCAHGFRTTASTLLNGERRANGDPAWHPDVIELSLAHTDADEVRAIYNRAKLWPERILLMQHWADRLDQLRGGGRVLSLHRGTPG